MVTLTTNQEPNFQADISAVERIPIVTTMLEVICRTTGMGFAAVARVTTDRWIACSVRDEISFGLLPGGELDVQTTICDEIRDSGQPVIIDNVEQDANFQNHPTPKQYGFQSYISVPIRLLTGEFFGTLCAIDPKPAQLNNTKTIGMFTLFAELIAFHLQSLTAMERSQSTLRETHEQLALAREDNRQYEHLAFHSLREPLRKITLFTDMFLQDVESADMEKARQTAGRLHSFSQELDHIIRQLKP